MSCMRPAGSFRSEKFFLLLALSMKKISEKRGCGNFYPPKKTKRGPCGQGPEKIISEKSCAGRKRLNALKSQSSSRSGAMPHTGGRAGQNKKLSHVSALLARPVRYIWAKTKSGGPLTSRPGSRPGSRDADSANLAPRNGLKCLHHIFRRHCTDPIRDFSDLGRKHHG